MCKCPVLFLTFVPPFFFNWHACKYSLLINSHSCISVILNWASILASAAAIFLSSPLLLAANTFFFFPSAGVYMHKLKLQGFWVHSYPPARLYCFLCLEVDVSSNLEGFGAVASTQPACIGYSGLEKRACIRIWKVSGPQLSFSQACVCCSVLCACKPARIRIWNISGSIASIEPGISSIICSLCLKACT